MAKQRIQLLIILSVVMSVVGLKLAVITGGNKGIGYEIVEKIASKGYKTILAARNPSLGIIAANSFVSKGYDVEYRELDISSPSSISEFCHKFDSEFGCCDILVNNAAIAFKGSDPTSFTDQAEPTISVNFFGTLNLIVGMLPLLKKSKSPRIVNVSSQAGLLQILPSKERRDFFSSPELSVDGIVNSMKEFISDVKSGQHRERGWPNSCYGTSKLALTALTKVLARMEPTVMINACCPGYCKTDMSSNRGTKSAEEGARTPAMLALIPSEQFVSGKFFVDEEEAQW